MLSDGASLNSHFLGFSVGMGELSRPEGPTKLCRHGLLLGQWLLELPELQPHRGEIAEVMALLRSGSTETLLGAVGGLRHQIQTLLPEGVATLLFNASYESSPVLFAQSMVEIAQVYRSQGDFATPVGLYSVALKSLPNTDSVEGFRKQLEGKIAALRGEGSISDSFKLGLERLPHELKSPMVLAMAAGSLANPLTSRLLGNALRGRLTQVARVGLSRLGGVGADAMAFTGVQHGIALASGQPTNSFGHDLLHAGLMLTSLRVTGTLARTTLQAQRVQKTLSSFGHLTKRSVELGLPLLAEYQGILRANQLGASFGLGQMGSHAGLETLFTMGHFRFAGSLLKLSPHYARLHHQLTLETENTLRNTGHRALQGFHQTRWQLAHFLKQRHGLSFATEGVFSPSLQLGSAFMTQMKPKTTGLQGSETVPGLGEPLELTEAEGWRDDPFLDRLQHVRGRVIDLGQEHSIKSAKVNGTEWGAWSTGRRGNTQHRLIASIVEGLLVQDKTTLLLLPSNKHWQLLQAQLSDSKIFHQIRLSGRLSDSNRVARICTQGLAAASGKHLVVIGQGIQHVPELLRLGNINRIILTYQNGQYLGELPGSHRLWRNALGRIDNSTPLEFVEFTYRYSHAPTLQQYYRHHLEFTEGSESWWQLRVGEKPRLADSKALSELGSRLNYLQPSTREARETLYRHGLSWALAQEPNSVASSLRGVRAVFLSHGAPKGEFERVYYLSLAINEPYMARLDESARREIWSRAVRSSLEEGVSSQTWAQKGSFQRQSERWERLAIRFDCMAEIAERLGDARLFDQIKYAFLAETSGYLPHRVKQEVAVEDYLLNRRWETWDYTQIKNFFSRILPDSNRARSYTYNELFWLWQIMTRGSQEGNRVAIDKLGYRPPIFFTDTMASTINFLGMVKNAPTPRQAAEFFDFYNWEVSEQSNFLIRFSYKFKYYDKLTQPPVLEFFRGLPPQLVSEFFDRLAGNLYEGREAIHQARIQLGI